MYFAHSAYVPSIIYYIHTESRNVPVGKQTRVQQLESGKDKSTRHTRTHIKTQTHARTDAHTQSVWEWERGQTYTDTNSDTNRVRHLTKNLTINTTETLIGSLSTFASSFLTETIVTTMISCLLQIFVSVHWLPVHASSSRKYYFVGYTWWPENNCRLLCNQCKITARM